MLRSPKCPGEAGRLTKSGFKKKKELKEAKLKENPEVGH